MSESTISRRDFLKASGALIASTAATGVGDSPAQTAPSTSPTLALSLNQTTFRPGDTLRIGLTVRNTGPLLTADFYLGVILPDGITVYFVTGLSPLNGVVTRLDANPATFQPLFANVLVSQSLDLALTDFVTFTVSQSLPAGDYVFFATLTPPGAFADGRIDAGDLLAFNTQSFRVIEGPVSVTTLGAVEGFVYGENPITLGATATSPAGTVPLAGASISVVNSAVIGTVEANGHFLLQGVEAGLRRLRVTTAGGIPAEFPVTIIGGATMRVGAPTIRREQAIDRVRLAITGFASPGNTFILGPQHPLPAGVIVEPALGDDNGDADPSLVLPIMSPQWFFYVDPHGTSRFQHAAQFVFVDAATGDLTAHEATSWPAINGLNYYGNRDVNFGSADLVQSPVIQAPLITGVVEVSGDQREPSVHPASHVPGCTNATTYALLVQASDESNERADMVRIKELFGKGGVPPAYVSEYKPPSAHPRDDVIALFNSIVDRATPCDTVLIYITAHGTKGGAAKLDTTAVNKDGTPVGFEALTAQSFDFSRCRACHIVIIIDACYSGRWITNLTPRFTPPTSKKVWVMTAADSTHESVGFDTFDIRGTTGGAFTTAFVSAFTSLAASNPSGEVSLGTAFDNANTALAGTVIPSEVRLQNPQFFFSWNGQPCGPAATLPRITGFSPSSGAVGASVLISGENFTNATGVTIAGRTASFTVSSPTMITATVPAGATTGSISVTTSAGTATSSTVFTSTEPAVLLDQPFGIYPTGTRIALRRFAGGHVAAPDACTAQHYHGPAAFIDQGMTLQQGPIADPNPTGCGYGRIVQIPIQ